jgi:hypothetical protein
MPYCRFSSGSDSRFSVRVAEIRTPNQDQSSILMALDFSSATQLVGAIQDRRVPAAEVLDAHLARIERHPPAERTHTGHRSR